MKIVSGDGSGFRLSCCCVVFPRHRISRCLFLYCRGFGLCPLFPTYLNLLDDDGMAFIFYSSSLSSLMGAGEESVESPINIMMLPLCKGVTLCSKSS